MINVIKTTPGSSLSGGPVGIPTDSVSIVGAVAQNVVVSIGSRKSNKLKR